MNGIPLPARLLLLVFAIGSVFVFSSGWKELGRSKRIEEEVARLRDEADRVRGDNGALSDRIEFFATESFEEREAKGKLGMKKRGEEAVDLDVGVVLGSDTKDRSVSETTIDGSVRQVPNYLKWLKRFRLVGAEGRSW